MRVSARVCLCVRVFFCVAYAYAKVHMRAYNRNTLARMHPCTLSNGIGPLRPPLLHQMRVSAMSAIPLR